MEKIDKSLMEEIKKHLKQTPLDGYKKLLALLMGTGSILLAQHFGFDPLWIVFLYVAYLGGQSAIDVTKVFQFLGGLKGKSLPGKK